MYVLIPWLLSLGLVTAAVLTALMAAGLAGFWSMGHGNGRMTLALLAGAAALVTFVRVDATGRWLEARFWALLLGGAALAFSAAESGYTIFPCLLTGAIVAWLASASWDLAHTRANDLFRSNDIV